MLDSNVLVLNRSYLPIHITSVRRAFSMLYQEIARAVHTDYQSFDFHQWRRFSADGLGPWLGTSSGPIRIPRVIVLLAYDKIPKRHVRFSRVNIFARDRFTCQYCGSQPPRSQLNLDHVVPRALGGKTSWENVVCSCVDCNRRKGGRTPKQARLRLNRKPVRPRWTPLVNLAAPQHERYEEWRPFLGLVDSSQRMAAAG
ncbi:MAG: HNH endonuclease [Myxococcales bacterium]|nr:HNH endonuclease [Myxococcales bacterium]